MAVNNPWLNPLQRSYQNIRGKLIEKLKERVPEITDYSEGNIFVLIISVWAAIAEVIHYYIDNMARETFMVTARRYSSLQKHAAFLDYRIKSATPASVDVTIFREGNKPFETDLSIPLNTEFVASDGSPWLTSKTILIEAGMYSINIPLVQKSLVSKQTDLQFGTVTSEDIIISITNIPSGQLYADNTLTLKVDGEYWTSVETFAYSKASDKVFKVVLDDNLKPVIVFGDGKFGRKPTIGSILSGNYYYTYGQKGNIGSSSFTAVPNSISSVQSDVKSTNIFAASGGTDYEDFVMLKQRLPLSIKTLGVAITKSDYEDLVMTYSGVNKAYVNYICGRFVQIYITPQGGGEASQALLDEVESKISMAKVITTSVSIYSTNAIECQIKLDITGRKSFNSLDIDNQVKKALVDNFNLQTSDIGKPLRISDLYALLDNQTMVDHLTITKLNLVPYPYPLNPTQMRLVISEYNQLAFKPEDPTTLFEDFLIEVIKVNSQWMYKVTSIDGDSRVLEFNKLQRINGNYCTFDISLSNQQVAYNESDKYRIYIQPMDKDLVPLNYSMPVFSTKNINTTIYETV